MNKNENGLIISGKKRSYSLSFGTSNQPNNTNKSNRTSIDSGKHVFPKNDDIPGFFFVIGNMESNEHNHIINPPPSSDDEDNNDNYCTGRFCDHDPYSTNVPIIPQHLIDVIQDYNITLDDLINLGLSYHCCKQKYFHAISLNKLSILVKSLEKLRGMIGMTEIKTDFVEQIVYFIQDIEPNPFELLHSIIEGPPGVGKTHVIDILAEIYLNMGFLKKNIVKKVKRSDLIGKYLGHTAVQTQKAIDSACGGILVIDEAYSLGNSEKRDSYAKECIDTINRNLTEKANEFICIIIGYEKELNESFFSYNPGLKSRFRHKFNITGYSSDELLDIFKLKISICGWKLDDTINDNILTSFFKTKHLTFKSFGRDIESLLFHTKKAHSNRVFFQTNKTKWQITMNDIKEGHKRFMLHNSTNEILVNDTIHHMYV